MVNNIKYAILKYVPNIERNERINVGIVLHSISTTELEMISINNWNRVKKFDDEVDISFLKKYVEDLKEKFNNNSFSNKELKDNYLLDNMTKYFVNKFIFEIHEFNTNEKFTTLLDNLKKIYLYYDINKPKRINEKESMALIEKTLIENNILYERRGTKNIIKEEYGNNINFDYKIKDKYYKIIFLTEDNYNGYIAMLKMWIANSIILKKENKELIFVLDDNINNNKTNNYKRMLTDYGKVITIKEFINMKSID